jgi:hypothetical protein
MLRSLRELCDLRGKKTHINRIKSKPYGFSETPV